MVASAQSEVPQSDDVQGVPSESVANSSGVTERASLDEIIVTAQRREENLQNAALAVSAVTGAQLTDLGITQSTGLSRLFPSIQIQPAHSFTQIYLRGVGTFGANSFAENSVAFNYDGVYLSRPAAPAGLFYDIERIEVLKGPQGTLYGRNATGGAINVIPVRPKLEESGGFLTAEYGNHETVRASGAVNASIGESAALRLSGQISKHDGYFSDGSDDEDIIAVRGQFLLDPVGSNFDVLFSMDYAEAGGVGGGGTILPLLQPGERLGVFDPRVIAAYQAVSPTAPVPQVQIPNAGSQDSSFFGVHATLNWDLGFANLTVIPAYRETSYDVTSMSGGFVLDIDEQSEQTSLEVRLTGDTERFNWVLGAYRFDENVDSLQTFDQASNKTDFVSALTTESTAIFGQATYSLTDTFRLTGGLRYTSDVKTQDTLLTLSPFVGFVPNVFPLQPIFLNLQTIALTDHKTDKMTWKAGVEYDVSPDSLLYTTVSTGYKSGVPFAALAPNNISKPEGLTAYTLGSKNRFLSDSLQLNLEAFVWKYKDQQVSHLGPVEVAPGINGPVFITENAGKLSIKGVEAELLYQLTSNDLLSVDVQYLDTNYDELEYQAFSSSGASPAVGCQVSPTSLTTTTPRAAIYDVDCSGQPGVNSPKWTINLGYEHIFDLGASGTLTFGADTRFQSGRYLTVDFLPDAYQGSFMKSNARITYETHAGGYWVSAFVDNIEDEFTFSGSVQSPVKNGLFFNRVAPPRTYGIRAGVRF
ncbi:MAG: TonB-dependent receptor [Robiginitomaculum sp.]|nr:MAG: TonB-dependent receptor [Robiginitomaculum sp.]